MHRKREPELYVITDDVKFITPQQVSPLFNVKLRSDFNPGPLVGGTEYLLAA